MNDQIDASMNGCFGDGRGIVANHISHVRTNAASATIPNINLCKVRAFPVDAHCSERHLDPEPPSMDRAANEVQSLRVFETGVAKALTL